MNEQLWPKKIILLKKWKFTLFILIVVGMSIQGRKNIKEQLKIKGKKIKSHLFLSLFPFENI
jgi:hypothetical protein